MKTKIKTGTISMILIGIILLLASSCQKEEESSEIKDKDGNIYTSVTIGTQVWMVENLKTTKYKDGTSIPLVADNTAWSNLASPGYCWYNNNELSYKNTYGALYNWHTVKTGILCPTGWHVPTMDEWEVLETYLGIASPGGKLKETGTTHWTAPNTGATNETGFAALPGGDRFEDGRYLNIGINGYWWGSSDYTTQNAKYINLNSTSIYVGVSSTSKKCGFSVRCLRD